jgi:ferredoxin-NADP reductase
MLMLTVVDIKDETPRIKRFVLRDSEGRDLPPAEPGSHLVLSLQPLGRCVEREYSVVFSDAKHYEIAIQREDPGRGGSQYLHDHVRVGDVLPFVGGPQSDFPLNMQAARSLMIAGGIGITPIFSMLTALCKAGRELELHYGARTRQDFAFKKEIEALAKERAFFYASRQPDGKRIAPLEGGPSPRVDLPALFAGLSPDTHVYVCGPRSMLSQARELFASRGLPSEQLHIESFGSSAPSERPIAVTLKQSDETIEVAADQSILDLDARGASREPVFTVR